jgi:hypothetical protein
MELLPEVPVASAVASLFGWHHQLDSKSIFKLIDSFVDRIVDGRDYLATISWTSLALHNVKQLGADQERTVYRLVAMRSTHPDLGAERWAWARLAERLSADYALRIVQLIVALAAGASVVMLTQDEEAGLMRRVAAHSPTEAWSIVGNALLEGDWRVVLALRPWVTDAFESSVIEAWIGNSDQRAERVASVANAGRDAPTAITIVLLGKFSHLDRVKSELAGHFVSGGWTGPASAHYAQQIAQLEGWAANRAYPRTLRDWARSFADDIRKMRDRALQMEAEGEFGI